MPHLGLNDFASESDQSGSVNVGVMKEKRQKQKARSHREGRR
ncbi:hypothetical protein OP10G_4247 [Fimbriimonas ginsengisoli Gsoil 348]|uniref:Uncharacterized protein n=1 Tax=Fimbriimonas ginsengisoli Gsoil 348 TaxID=661478 RepID=A0A068NXV8_FIMGI|nr:hypothetical protein OP10G_4247 [Fimbriimonas ginsengisoli Gsoil 348]